MILPLLVLGVTLLVVGAFLHRGIMAAGLVLLILALILAVTD